MRAPQGIRPGPQPQTARRGDRTGVEPPSGQAAQRWLLPRTNRAGGRQLRMAAAFDACVLFFSYGERHIGERAATATAGRSKCSRMTEMEELFAFGGRGESRRHDHTNLTSPVQPA